MPRKKIVVQEAFLKLGSLNCTHAGCKAKLHFEVLGTMRVKRQHTDGRWYYPARCGWDRCGESYKVEAPSEPVDKEIVLKPKVKAAEAGVTQAEKILNLGALCLRMAQALKKLDPKSELPKLAVDYVNSHVMKPNPLRGESNGG